MKAAVYHRYGGPEVVQVTDLPDPVPKDNEVLIRVRATTVSSADWRARSLEMPPGFGMLGRLVFGVRKPRKPILGTELAGDVIAVGAAVHSFKPGDAVFAFPGGKLGAHAELVAMAADRPIALKPANLSYEEAAALSFGGTTALHFLTKGKVKSGERLVIVGASGSVGSAAVQIGKAMGAHVTAVCSAANADLVRSTGADAVIDYRAQDFAAVPGVWDVILDATATAPIRRSMPALRDGGRLLIVLGGIRDMIGASFASRGGKKVIAGVAPERAEDLRRLAELAAAGSYRPVIDEVFPVERIADAHRRVDSGRKRGNVVVTF